MKKSEFTYWRSTLSGQCYQFPVCFGAPEGQGWEPIHEATYHKWCREHGLEA